MAGVSAGEAAGVSPREALLIVDFQNDFLPGGALAVPDSDAIAAHIRALTAAERFALVVATRDWHPADHSSFRAQDGPWPVHCVRDTHGAQLHESLTGARIDLTVDKGVERDGDGYSAFDATELARILHERSVDSLTVVGLATDYCVKSSALDALGEGFAVTIDAAGARGIDARDSQLALEAVRAAGGRVVGGD